MPLQYNILNILKEPSKAAIIQTSLLFITVSKGNGRNQRSICAQYCNYINY